jgi:hypothetical protein
VVYESTTVRRLRELILGDYLSEAIDFVLGLDLSQANKIVVLIAERQYMMLLKEG